jgi:hypothetical protein
MNTFVRLTQPWPNVPGAASWRTCCSRFDGLEVNHLALERRGPNGKDSRGLRRTLRLRRPAPHPWGEAEIRRIHVSHEAVITQYHRNNDPSVFSHYLIERIRGFAPGRQGVSEQEVTDWAGDLQKIGERGGYFFCLNQFLFVVVKPLREQ